MNERGNQRSMASDRAGFSILEIMIALVVLTVAVMSLSTVSLAAARQGRRISGRSFEIGLLTQEIDRAVAAPIESLAVKIGQTKLDTPVVATPWTYARRVTISGRADSLTVGVTILPLSPLQRPDSITQTVLRTR
ncbi:MAG TPA: prepilin-type N-terminal cleavage/methylation domain-containing protein [Gemmatimonadaceae bacterium]|nr:prepilin-type N-terminal cleavage/methylation domain-containing protein [Gemmatimonadaceae bacterium]